MPNQSSAYAISSLVQIDCLSPTHLNLAVPTTYAGQALCGSCRPYVPGCHLDHRFADMPGGVLVRHVNTNDICPIAHPGYCGRDHPDGETCLAWRCDYRREGHHVHPGQLLQQCPGCNLCIGWHCRCHRCEACGRLAEYGEGICHACNRCGSNTGCNACDCCFCDDCGDYVPASLYDEARDCCHSCAENRWQRSVTFRNPRTPTFHAADKSQRRINKSARFAALEIEVAQASPGSAIDAIARKWNASIVEDGSLPSTGFEINTAPAAGDVLLDQISDWAESLRTQNASADRSCGLHVHVDARDFSHYDIRHLILLYELIEPALFSMVPTWRRHSSYCYPCGTLYGNAVRNGRVPKLNKKLLVNGIYGTGTSDRQVQRAIQEAKYSKYASERYHALNIHSWFYRGTVELRLPAGTVNKTALRSWALLMVALVDKANVITEHELAEFTKLVSRDVLFAITPTEIHGWINRRLRDN